ncbi:MAG TPA: hypothetical protein VGE02_11060 [Gemmatimonadales bacterium]
MTRTADVAPLHQTRSYAHSVAWLDDAGIRAFLAGPLATVVRRTGARLASLGRGALAPLVTSVDMAGAPSCCAATSAGCCAPPR